ncbi:MAG: NBR1-Ig-like domain-containing protein [Anaerolineales bacterium]
MRKHITILLALIFILSACIPGQSQQDIDSVVNTVVAQTMEANARIEQAVNQTLTAQAPFATATLEFTATPEPTFEPLIIITDTPFPTLTNTSVPFVPQSQSQQPTPQPYSCYVETRLPAYREEIKAGTNFEIRWFVKNTGTRTWDAGVDLKYASGVKMTAAERVEIKSALAPGEVYKISITGKAPKNSGVQQMTWMIEGKLCYANVVIVVK